MTDRPPPLTDLDEFRRRWRQEVSERTAGSRTTLSGPSSVTRSGNAINREPPPSTGTYASQHEDSTPYTYHDLPDREDNLRLNAAEKGLDRTTRQAEPRTALEHYERAVEQETAGRLGDSLQSYRRAFKLDDGVHEIYKAKHFPSSAFPPKQPQSSRSAASTTSASTQKKTASGPVSSLISSFAGLGIVPVEPPTDASPQPPCPIAALPTEVLATILMHVGNTNVGAFAKLAVVCKRFAYLTVSEEQVWRSVVLSRLQGFGDMHYNYICDVFGKPLAPATDVPYVDDGESIPRGPSFLDVTDRLLSSQYGNSWRQMFRSRPRIRFHGVYISTVNYTRPGGASATINTWSTPVHVVTYYRYLRFYRDGTVISLLTVAEPVDVVHILTKDQLTEQSTDPRQHRRTHHLERAQPSKPPPTSLPVASSSHGGHQVQHTEQPHALSFSQIMKDALRGRWRITGPGDGTDSAGPDGRPGEAEGDVHIETEGVIPKYMYKMHFGIGSSSAGTAANTAAQTGQNVGGKRGSRNNRLTWKGFWSYNRLTDDWGEFTLKNDKAFYFSRVKSYGNGG